MPRRYIIVGSGVAGVSAADAIRREDPLGQLTLIGDDRDGYYSRPGIAYLLSGTIPEQQLFPRSAVTLRALIPNRVYARVTDVLPEEHQVILANGSHLCYDRLLLATGSYCVPGDFPGNDLNGVVKLYTLEDVRGILRLARRGGRAIVVGGGIIAVELAEGLAAQGMNVHYLLRGDRFWAAMLDEVESSLVEGGLEEAGIRLHHRTQVAQALGRGGALETVVTKTGEKVHCRILGVATGVRANIDLAQRAGLAIDRGILVNEYLEASAADIFAAGDVAQVRDPRSGGTWLETLWPIARVQGQVAGLNMTGSHTRCCRDVSFNTVRIGGIVTTTIGELERARDPAVTAVALAANEIRQSGRVAGGVEHADPVNRIRVLLGERTIVGAVVMGDQTAAYPLLRMIKNETDISHIRGALATHPERAIGLVARFLREGVRADVGV